MTSSIKYPKLIQKKPETVSTACIQVSGQTRSSSKDRWCVNRADLKYLRSQVFHAIQEPFLALISWGRFGVPSIWVCRKNREGAPNLLDVYSCSSSIVLSKGFGHFSTLRGTVCWLRSLMLSFAVGCDVWTTDYSSCQQ